MLISLSKGYVTEVDRGDFERLIRYRWFASISKKRNRSYVYARTHIDGKKVYMHRFLLGARKGQEVDHKDLDTLNNRRKNLRLCSHSQNAMNRLKPDCNSSGFKGVYYDARRISKPWYAKIKENRRSIHLGTFKTPEEAVKAYGAAAEKYFGEYRR